MPEVSTLCSKLDTSGPPTPTVQQSNIAVEIRSCAKEEMSITMLVYGSAISTNSH